MVSRGKEKMFENCLWWGGLRLRDGIKALGVKKEKRVGWRFLDEWECE